MSPIFSLRGGVLRGTDMVCPLSLFKANRLSEKADDSSHNLGRDCPSVEIMAGGKF